MDGVQVMKLWSAIAASFVLTASPVAAAPRNHVAARAAQPHRDPPAHDAGAAATPLQVPPSAPNSANQVVARLQEFYNRTTDFEADFTQQSHNRLSGQNQQRVGHVRFQRPGRMRWDYQNPSGDVIVSDGTTLWAYEAAARQAVQSSLAQSQLPSALSFLTGTGQLSNDFTFRMLDARQMRYPQGFVLEARPIQPNPSFERVVFYVDAASYQVVRTVLFDAEGNSNSFVFANPRVNTNPALALFQWTPPRGTQIVRP
jgi:outer membrane lipoprotein carrier protein